MYRSIFLRYNRKRVATRLAGPSASTKLAPLYLILKKECFQNSKIMLVIPTFVSCFKDSIYLLKGENKSRSVVPLKMWFATILSKAFQVKFSSDYLLHLHGFFLFSVCLVEIQCMYIVYPFKIQSQCFECI